MLDEPAHAPRLSGVRALGEAAGVRFVDIERVSVTNGPGSLGIRRQIVQWQGSTWITLDTYADTQARELRVLWTSAAETLQRGSGPFRHERPGAPVALTLSIDGSPGVRARPLRGSRQPFGGWMAFDRKVADAPAVDARLPAPGGWMVATLDLHAPGASPLRAHMVRHLGPEDWTLQVVRGAGAGASPSVELTRRSDMLVLRHPSAQAGETATRIMLAPSPDSTAAQAQLERARAALLAAHPRVATHDWLRRRHTMALCVLWLVTSVGLVLAHLMRHRRSGRSDSTPAT